MWEMREAQQQAWLQLRPRSEPLAQPERLVAAKPAPTPLQGQGPRAKRAAAEGTIS